MMNKIYYSNNNNNNNNNNGRKKNLKCFQKLYESFERCLTLMLLNCIDCLCGLFDVRNSQLNVYRSRRRFSNGESEILPSVHGSSVPILRTFAPVHPFMHSCLL